MADLPTDLPPPGEGSSVPGPENSPEASPAARLVPEVPGPQKTALPPPGDTPGPDRDGNGSNAEPAATGSAPATETLRHPDPADPADPPGAGPEPSLPAAALQEPAPAMAGRPAKLPEPESKPEPEYPVAESMPARGVIAAIAAAAAAAAPGPDSVRDSPPPPSVTPVSPPSPAPPPASRTSPAEPPASLRRLPRVRAEGKFLWAGSTKFFLHGATYGPFGPGDRNHGLPAVETVIRDLDDMRAWGANALRVYHLPPEWFLELCGERGLRVVISIPWGDHVDFLRRDHARQAIRDTVRDAALRLAAWPEAAVLLVGNEIPATLVRWLGPRRVQSFIEDLIRIAKTAAPDILTGYANYPGTEFLQPANADFAAFNVYLEDRTALQKYFARLQNLAGDLPLLITEFGADTLSHGPERAGEILEWERGALRDCGAAGNLVFSWTDEWFRGGTWVTGWAFGLTARSRTPRPGWHALADGPPLPAHLLPARPPRVSVIICTRNGSATLEACLLSLTKLNWPDPEIILVDDGSTDRVPEIAADFPSFRYIRQEGGGLSVARNTGAAAATGDIFVYTDDDCRADPDWILYLVKALEDPSMAAAGGPNIPPPPRSLAQACVTAAPGGPAHVLLTDRLAEHVPGCNLAVRRTAFEGINGFRPKYHAAGDDVDFCWRLQEAGGGIAFAPAAMVWHDRRTTVGAFLRQQRGYGKAEALLMTRHAGRFGQMGGARWRGVVYQPAILRLMQHAGRIYTGVFGYAPFQALYRPGLPEIGWMLTGFPWWVIMLAVAVNGLLLWQGALWIAAFMLLLTLVHTGRQAWLLRPGHPWPVLRGFGLLWFLMIAQPLVRGWARFFWNLKLGSAPKGPWLPSFRLPGAAPRTDKAVTELAFWSADGKGRDALLAALTTALEDRGARPESGDGWRDWDLEARISRWWRLRLATVTEYHQAPGQLTRVRFLSRITALWFLLQLLILAGCVAAAVLSHIHVLWAVGLFFVWSIVFEMLHHRAITRAAHLVHDTAGSLGMSPLPSPPSDPAPSSSSSSPPPGSPDLEASDGD